jgi:hypothetical protein
MKKKLWGAENRIWIGGTLFIQTHFDEINAKKLPIWCLISANFVNSMNKNVL